MSDEEDWRAVPGFVGYQVSSLGRVRSYRKRKDLFPKLMLINRRPPAYRATIGLHCGKTLVTLNFSRLVCTVFNGPPPTPEHQAAHDNGDIYDDSAANLIWKTAEENMADRERHGRTMKGFRHHSARLWPEDAVNIRIAYDRHKATGNRVYRVVSGLARQYGVTVSCIEDIVYRRSWTHICLGSEIMAGHLGECHIGGRFD